MAYCAIVGKYAHAIGTPLRRLFSHSCRVQMALRTISMDSLKPIPLLREDGFYAFLAIIATHINWFFVIDADAIQG